MAAGQESYKSGDLNLEATELRLGLPDQTSSSTPTTTSIIKIDTQLTKSGSKRSRTSSEIQATDSSTTPSSKTQIVGWPPVRSYRKNNTKLIRCQGAYVKVDMDGAPYLRKIDLKGYSSYGEMVTAIEMMFKVVMREDYIPTYQDKDGDWMLAGDVPWEMFVESCKRVRIMKSSDAKGMMGCL